MSDIKQKRPISIQGMGERVWKREDNTYKLQMIQEILKMYFDECEKALENGEKVKLSKIGSLSPKVHTPITYNVHSMNDEDGNKPYTTIQFTRGRTNKQKMNSKYLKNIKDGFAGIGEQCKCNKLQINILIDKGFLKPEETEEDGEE